MKRRELSITTARRPRPVLPDRADLVDATALFILGLLAIGEFHSTFAGWNYLAVAALGMVLGLTIAHIANVLRQPAIVLIAMGVGAFFLLGGAIALRNAPGAGVIPTLGTLRGLADGSVQSWRALLTTVPPVDGNGPLLVLPYMLSLFLGLGGFALARRNRSAFWPLSVPLVVFGAVIVLGSLAPSATVLIATGFAVVSLLWVKARNDRERPVSSSGSGQAVRLASATGLFAMAAITAYFVGPLVPGAHAHDRVVLRKYIVPPFNIGDYPSPLAEFRLYAQAHKVNGEMIGLKNTSLFSVSGSLPAGSSIEFATLDNYNGSVWAATNQAAAISGKLDSFLRVGEQLDNPAAGRRYTMRVTVGAYDDYWLPAAGAVQRIAFGGSDGQRQAGEFRYNLATGTGVVPGKITAGDQYSLTVAGVRPRLLTADASLSAAADGTEGDFLKDSTVGLAGTPQGLAGQVLTLARNLKAQGRYTDGDAGSGFEYYLPGHSQARLSDFAKGVIPGVKYVGDDEQFAAAFALMIEQLGVPARVVIGVESLPADGVVRGHDVTAWVQVAAADGGWLTVPSSVFTSTVPPDKKQLQQQTQQDAGSNVPPPPQGHPKSNLDDAAVSDSDSHNHVTPPVHAGWRLPAWVATVLMWTGPPAGFLVVLCSAIIGLKAIRRRRRRTRGEPALRFARGWREILDHARDLGSAAPGRATRREQAIELHWLGLGPLAMLTDRHVFGPDAITDADAHGFWREVDAERKRMSGTVSRWRRWRAALSVASFAPPRRADASRSAGPGITVTVVGAGGPA